MVTPQAKRRHGNSITESGRQTIKKSVFRGFLVSEFEFPDSIPPYKGGLIKDRVERYNPLLQRKVPETLNRRWAANSAKALTFTRRSRGREGFDTSKSRLNFRRSEVILSGMMDAKKFNERTDLDSLLECLLELDGFVPSSIADSERPDFIINVADQIIGVETTRSVHEEYARALKLQATQYPSLWINTTHFKARSRRRTNDELTTSMGYRALLQPWRRAEDRMLDWEQKIAAAPSSKRQKYTQSDYQIFDENWLLIHDYPPLPGDDFTRSWAEHRLNVLFRESSGLERDFETVFVHSGAYVFRWHEGELLRAGLPIQIDQSRGLKAI